MAGAASSAWRSRRTPKWFIDFGEPIPMDKYKPGAEQNLMLVSQLTDHVRNVVQGMIFSRLASGLIKVRGPAWKLSPLIGVIQAGREFYPQALQKHGLVR